MPSGKTVKVNKVVKQQQARRSTRLMGVSTVSTQEELEELTLAPKPKKNKHVIGKKAIKAIKATAFPSVNAFNLLIKEVSFVLNERRCEQVEFAKKKGWTYDPRAPVEISPTMQDLCLVGLGKISFDDIVDSLILTFAPTFANADNECDENYGLQLSPFEQYCMTVSQELDSKHTTNPWALDFDDTPEAVFSFNHCLHIAAGMTPPSTKGAVEEFLKTHLDLNQLVIEYPYIPYFADVTPIESAKEEDPRDEDSDWCDKFTNHMMWLFDRFDEQKCTSIGRIHKAFGADSLAIPHEDEMLDKEYAKAVFSKMGGTYWGKLVDENSDEDEDSVIAMKRNHILRHALLSAPMDIRTYTGTFCYNVHESDYDGRRSGILEYVIDDAQTYFNPFEFIVADTLQPVGLDIEDEIQNVVTSAFYIPGMGEDSDGDSDME
jgi:hypothetical protein